MFSSKFEYIFCGMGNIYVIFCYIGFDIGIYIYYDKVFGIGDNFLFIVLCKGFDFLLMVFL